MPDTEQTELQQALDRYFALRDACEEGRAAYMALSDDVRELRGQVQRLVNQLDEARRKKKFPRRDPELEARLEAQITAAKQEKNRKSARMEELGERNGELRRLADACRRFLEANGATIEGLAAGISLPARHGAGVDVDRDRNAEGRAADRNFAWGSRP